MRRSTPCPQGKILLAQLPKSELDAYLTRVAFEPVTSSTLTSAKALHAQIRSDGFAYSREEFTPGIATVVASGPRMYGALNLAVPTARFTADRDGNFRRVLTSISSVISHVLAAHLKA